MEIYNENLKHLLEYPYIYGLDCEYKINCEESKNVQSSSYYFENLDKPLFLENVVDFKELKYLYDNVRASEDYGGDNHIYLFYNDMAVFSEVLYIKDLESLLCKRKFVFLIGEKYKDVYPIDFKKDYGIDYDSMPEQELRVEELNRIVYNKSYVYSGTAFFHGIMQGSDCVLDVFNYFFYTSRRGVLNLYHKLLDRAEEEISIELFIQFIQKYQNDIKMIHWQYIMEDLIPKLRNSGKSAMKFLDIWKNIALSMMKLSEEYEGKCYKTRISPVIFYDSHFLQEHHHYNYREHYYNLMKSFAYPSIVAAVREPMTQLVRWVEAAGLSSNVPFFTDMISQIYNHSKGIPQWILDSGYYVARLEDLKKYPEDSVRAVCEAMNIPYQMELLNGKVGMFGVVFKNEKGEALSGFDPRSLNRTLSNSLNEFDKKRLELIYGEAKRYFRYDTPDDIEYSEEEIRKLFSIPFQFEKIYAECHVQAHKLLEEHNDPQVIANIYEKYGMEPHILRKCLEDTFVELYMNRKKRLYKMPYCIFPKFMREEFIQHQELDWAIQLFEKGEYEEAFYVLMGTYNNSAIQEEKEYIMSIIMEAYYLPNVEEQEVLYEQNKKILKEYLYVFGEIKDSTQFIYCPINENKIAIYNQDTDNWMGIITTESTELKRNLFEGLSENNPFYFENEVNLTHLLYLTQNIRESELIGKDNHIYLYYEEMYCEILMRFVDLSKLVQKKNIVFLLGEAQKNVTSEDFLQKFNIQYTGENLGITIDDLDRLVFNKWYGYSGTGFLHDVMQGFPYVLDITNWDFYYSSDRIKRIYHLCLAKAHKQFAVSDIFLFLEKYKDEIKWTCKEEIIQALMSEFQVNNIKNITFGCFWKYLILIMLRISEKMDGKYYSGRMKPIIFYDPHYTDLNSWQYDETKLFQDVKLLAVVREPITRFTRWLESLGPGNTKELLFTGVGGVVDNTKFIPKEVMDKGFYVIQMEKLKQDPDKYIKKICDILQMPYEYKEIDKKGCFGVALTNEKNETLLGFDQRSIKRDLSTSLTVYDTIRLEMVFRRIKAYFGYKIVDNTMYSREEMEDILKVPFLFEKNYQNDWEEVQNLLPQIEDENIKKRMEFRYGITPKEMGEYLREILMKLYFDDEMYDLEMPIVLD